MRHAVQLDTLFSDIGTEQYQQLALFALLNLGIIQSLASGILGATEALRLFYNADNCQFVRKHFRNKTADRIMSHGVQLPDLFEALPVEEAHCEFHRELETMCSLCLQLLEARLSSA